MKQQILVPALSLVLALGAFSTSHAESYIFAVPSATVTDKGSLYCEGDANFATSSAGASGFMGRCMAGAYDGLEVGVNALGLVSKPASAAELQPNIKYQWFNKDGFQIATGITGFLPVTHTNTEEGFANLYTVGRYQTNIGALGGYAPAFSAGGWTLLGGGGNHTGSRQGVILGVEQPLLLDGSGAPQLSFAADWESGNQTHAGFSSLTPGLVLNLPHNFVMAAGYSISNVSSKYNTPAFWAGYTLKF